MPRAIAKTAPGKTRRPTAHGEPIALKYRESIAKGLDYLAKTQHQDGHWEAEGGQYPVNMTSLAGMALLMEGSTIHEGKYAQSLRKAVDWMMGAARRTGFWTVGIIWR